MMDQDGTESSEINVEFENIPLNEKLRQHPIKIAEELFAVAILAFFICISMYGSMFESGLGPMIVTAAPIATFVAIMAIAAWISYWRWRRTIIVFKETELSVFRDTVFKREVRIAYTKIASINVNRGLINRLTDTSKLIVNINSSVNAITPEARLTFGLEQTDRIRADLSRKMYDNKIESEEHDSMPSIVTITKVDVVLHSLLSQPTASALFGIGMFIFGIYELLAVSGNSSTGIVALMIAILTYALPVLMMIFHYFNYKIYRIGDTIYVSHGFIRTYYKSFKVSKINAVRLRSPLLPRVIGRYMLDAEVVGLVTGEDGGNSNLAPLLCPMKDRGTIERVIDAIVPEFKQQADMKRQPREAAMPIFARAAVWSVIFSAIAYVFYEGMSRIPDTGGIDIGNVAIAIIAISAIVVIALFLNGIWSRKIVEYGMADDVFTFVTGVVDRVIVTVPYDKVQIADISSGPLSRPYGLAKCDVSLLSSVGSMKVTSGFFDAHELEAIPEEVISRIEDGRYDYRKYF